MQAMQRAHHKRFSISGIGLTAMVLGAMTLGLASGYAVSDLTQGSSDGAAARVARQHTPTDRGLRVHVGGQAVVPAAAAATQRTAAEIAFLEWNTLLPSASSSAAPSSEDIRFIEMNVLPGDIAPRVSSYAELRFLEWNTQLPADPAYYPVPVDGRPGTKY